MPIWFRWWWQQQLICKLPKKTQFFKSRKICPPPFFLADNCVVKKPAQKGNWPFFFLVVFLFFQLFWWRIEKNKKEFLPFRERVTFFWKGKRATFTHNWRPPKKEKKKQKIIAANGVCGKCVNLNLSNHFFLYFSRKGKRGFFFVIFLSRTTFDFQFLFFSTSVSI